MPATTAAASSPQWEDLPAELLLNISGRLHAASDSIRFHAVCWDWRLVLHDHSYNPPCLLPWLLAPSAAGDDSAEDQRCRCVFSKATYRAPGICVRDRRVARDDGTAAWLVSGKEGTISLVNPLTADRLPFPGGGLISDDADKKWLDHRHRVVSADGGAAVLLYDFDPNAPLQGYLSEYRFRASFRHHPGGEENWRRVRSSLGATDRCCAAAIYDHGRVVCVDLANCHVLTPERQSLGQYCYIDNTREVRAALPEEPGKVRRSSYLVEIYDGSLVLASILQEDGGDRPAGRGLSVSLHELRLRHGQNGGDELEVEWVRRDESDSDMSRLGEDVLFLGFPASFAAEAALFGGEVSGGTAYFVVENDKSTGSPAPEPCSVYVYSFHDGVATLVETLPPGWHDARCMWFMPDPQLLAPTTPIDPCEESDSDPAATPATRNSGGGADRRQELRIYAGDLSPKVDSSRLRQMFSVYGKVASTRVAYDKRGRSRGFGFVTMATQEGFDKAMGAAALSPSTAVEEPDGSVIFNYLFCALLILLFIFAVIYIFRG